MTSAIAALLFAAVVGGHLVSGTGVAAAPIATGSVQALVARDDACSKLAGRKFGDAEIISAQTQPAGVPVATGAAATGLPPVSGVPEFCRIVGRIVPEPGSSIGFEVWMPSRGWDGRLHGAGMGGFAGSIDYMALTMAVKAGEAAVSTDTGHRGTMMDTAWARNAPQRVRDYGWRAIHLSTVAAKAVIGSFYGSGPKYAYFVGCSGGGRQGLMEAARFPEDYDGIVAGAPAASWTDLAVAMINPVQAQRLPGAALRLDQAGFIQTEVLAQCDASDGQTDGLVADPRRCKFDVSKLVCGASKSAQCLSRPQASALRQIYAGSRDSAGRRVARAYLPGGSEVGTPAPAFGWEGYILNGPDGQSGGEKHVAGLLGDLVQRPFATPLSFDFDKDPARLKAALSNDLDAPQNLSRFFARGGKLILWHGWADAAIPPEATIHYRDALLRQSGVRARHSTQLFMVPGVQHCMGGTGPGAFGQLHAPQAGELPERNIVSALQHWVEKGRAPDTLVASRGLGGLMGFPISKPDRQRLLCDYPRQARLTPGADPDQASSYTCQ